MSKKKQSLEEQLTRLEQIQVVLEDGTAPLEEMLALYEEGMKLATEAREYLRNAEQKVVEIGGGKG